MVNLVNIFVAAGAVLASGVSALGKARVHNKCNFSVTAWSVGSKISGPFEIHSGKTFEEGYVQDHVTGGKAIKITQAVDGLNRGDPQTIFAYSLSGDTIFYDLSDAFGDAFTGNRLKVSGNSNACGRIVWLDGTPPAGSQVKSCTSTADVTLTLCA
ncbi:hypothetical protein XA68_12798 [Ophiocordyceps unilateralis]|uniref:Bys1 family protein n=1 Tax=Ophiocordyceps unilateralis TaxID=268505 RepID=A0A2A9PDX9_OPHUN|nr:hypothetical protein XA68_12798 [Ophiocordyceps unilateralis]